MACETNYLDKTLNQKLFRQTIAVAKRALKGVDFDAIVVTGNSGTIFGGALSYTMKKPLILIRKEGVDCHSSCILEGTTDVKKWLFVDDFISSGETKMRCLKIMAQKRPQAEFVGGYSYNHNRLRLA